MLSQSKINQIEASASEVLSSMYDNIGKASPPVNVTELLKKFSLTLKSGEFPDKNILGAYDKETKTILIAKDEHYKRVAFTIAHELGHYFLHDKKQTDVFYRSELIDLEKDQKQEEQEANWFAASLLMPRSWVEEYWYLTKNLDNLAVIFAVSPAAVYYRLKNLGLIE